jgi:biopolymer transport protein ExbB
MKTLATLFGVVAIAVTALADQPGGNEAISQLARSADQNLEKSIHELNQLRDQISTEKLPLAQKLTGLEDDVTTLRRKHDEMARVVDQGNLDIAKIKGEIKGYQEELSYVGNLLDEYARTFESKVSICEMQYCGKAVDSAKQVTENTTLAPSEKFTRQTDFVQLSIKRLSDVIGGFRFAGVGVDLEGSVVSGQFAIVGPVALFSAAAAGRAAGVVVPQSGSTNPLIRPLEGALQAGIAALVESGEGLLPLDPSRGGALKALVQKTNLWDIFQKGGPIMWPLLIASILALGTAVERILFLTNEQRKRDPKALERLFALVEKGEIVEAVRVSNESRFYVVRALGYALGHKGESLPNALMYATAKELKRFKRGIPILDTVITLAPLLGLLGTVTGMMRSFSLIGGELSAPGAITGGIAEALIATAFGLGIAITSLLPFNFLNARLEEARHELETAATQLELLVQPHIPREAVASNSHPRRLVGKE